ncbi:MAG: hypothetical protein AMJ53_18525 [Gammaproteobacteria bacterium SG8_11]|nr:MAG: hypothetical protein AMJ53_18525 [Gammaproteobacteria bacterium SG8_11]
MPYKNSRYTRISTRIPVMVLFYALSGWSFSAISDGELFNSGTGIGAQKHSLPKSAIDTQELPQFMLRETDKASDSLPVYKLSSDTYFLYGNIAQLDENNRGFNGNAGFVVTSEGVVVIDALGTPLLGKRLIATIRSITDKPIKYLIVTHNHPDHAYGASAFRDLPKVRIIMHQGMQRYINSEDFSRSVDYRQELLSKDMQGFSIPTPDMLISGERFSKQTVTIGGKTFDIYNVGEHHSYGDLIVHKVEDELVWISDLGFNQRTTYMGDGHSKQAIEAQTWLLKYFANAKLMVPGHGSAQTAPFPMVEKTKAYITDLRTKMAEWKNTRLYDVNHRANANFVYREMELEFFE